MQHNNLKSLIVETRELGYKTLEKIMLLDLPKLEYLELWFGADRDYRMKRYQNKKNDIELLNNLLMPLLFEDSFPNLKYLGLCNCEWSDDLVNFLKDSPIIQRLKILNMSKGFLTDSGAKILLNFPAIDRLDILDISMNLVSSEMINKLSQLKCKIIAEPQDKPNFYENECGRYRYGAVYE